MVSIVIASLDGPGRIDPCLRSIDDFTPEEHQVIVVDVPESGGDWAVPQAFNKGASDATGEYLVFLTADTLVTPSWLSQLLACVSETGAAAAGPLCNLLPGAQNLPPDLGTHPDIQSFARAFNRKDPSRWRQTVRIASAPMLISREDFQNLDGFDERFGSGGFADDDFCLRAALRGKRVFIAADTYVHRQGPRHILQGEPERIKVLDQEARRLCAKWNLDDPLAAQPRRDALSLIDVKGKRVLDVKCRTGATLQECAARGATLVTGIEDDRVMRSIATTSCSGLGDVRILRSTRGIPAKQRHDVILAVWQLERLPHPPNVLRRYRSLLSEDGILLAVVRNSWALSRLLPLLLTAPPPTYPRPAWGPSASPDDVLKWFRDAGLVVTAIRPAYAPQWGQEPFLDGFLKLAKKHGFLEDPKREYYSDECWFMARLQGKDAE